MPCVIDIEPIVIDWARTNFDLCQGRCAPKYKYKDLKFEIKWDRVDFVCDKTDYNFEDGKNTKIHVLFNSTYNNLSSVIQENWFTTERTTASTCTTTVEEGYKRGIYADFKLTALNKIIQISTGFRSAINVNKVTKEIHESSLTWKTKSLVRVKAKHRVTVSLKVEKETLTGKFITPVRLTGRVMVLIRSKKDNILLHTVDSDIKTILDGKAYFQTEGNSIVCDVKGTCQFSYGVKQFVEIEEEEIKE